MKLITTEKLIDVGSFSSSSTWNEIEFQIYESIMKVQWPSGSGKFLLYPESGKKRGRGSGVKPIKEAFLHNLNRYGWILEKALDIATYRRPGKIDALYRVRDWHSDRDVFFAVEWETGNISSSHRALNKMVIGLMRGKLIGGALVLPTRNMSQYLTDRVGNYGELAPYFPLWRALGSQFDDGLLIVIAIEHDGVSYEVARIPKGTNGRAQT
jgi:hypothetical protein